MYGMKLESPLDKLREPFPRTHGEPLDSASSTLVNHLLGHQAQAPSDAIDEEELSIWVMEACAKAIIASIVSDASTERWSARLESYYQEARESSPADATAITLGAASALYRGENQTANSRLSRLPPSSGPRDIFHGLIDLWSRRDIDWEDDSEQLHLLYTAIRSARGLASGGLAVLLMAAGALGDEELRHRLESGGHMIEEAWPRPELDTGRFSEWYVEHHKLIRPVDVLGEGRLGLWDPLLDGMITAFPYFMARPVVGRSIGSPAFEKLTKRRLKRMYADPGIGLEFQHRLGDSVDLTAGLAAADRLFRTAIIYGVPRFEDIHKDQGLTFRGPIRWVVTQGDQTLHELEVVVDGSSEED